MRFRLPFLKVSEGFWKRFPQVVIFENASKQISNENVPVWTGDFKNAQVMSINLAEAFSRRFSVEGWKRSKNGSVDVKHLLRFQWKETGGFWKRISVDVALANQIAGLAIEY